MYPSIIIMYDKPYKCKGCKEIGKVSTLVPAQYGFDSVLAEQTLRVSSGLK